MIERYFFVIFLVVSSRSILENYIDFFSALWMQEVQAFRVMLG